jgi:hypothetical protein
MRRENCIGNIHPEGSGVLLCSAAENSGTGRQNPSNRFAIVALGALHALFPPDSRGEARPGWGDDVSGRVQMPPEYRAV